jgi:hypothetical protein
MANLANGSDALATAQIRQQGTSGTQEFLASAAGGADDEAAATARPADPAIMTAATRAISRSLRVRWVRIADWFWLIGFLPVMFPAAAGLSCSLCSSAAGLIAGS